MARFLSNLAFAVLTVVLSAIILVVVVSPPHLVPLATHIQSRDGARYLAYQTIGDTRRKSCIIWLHGVLSSRNEILALDKGILEELDAYVVSYDRPGYGESSMLVGRGFESEVEHIEDLAASLGVDKFYLAGISGGGPYALAAASRIPERLKGVLLLSSAGPPGALGGPFLTAQQQAKYPVLLGALKRPWLVATFRTLAETYVGGRALYTLWLHEVAAGILARFSEVDHRCIMRQHKHTYMIKVLPESTKQGTATALLQDLLLIAQPWPFNLSSIPHALQSAIHIWHGTQDLQMDPVHAENLARQLPEAPLTVIKDGGHMAYWACNGAQQKQVLSHLLSLKA